MDLVPATVASRPISGRPVATREQSHMTGNWEETQPQLSSAFLLMLIISKSAHRIFGLCSGLTVTVTVADCVESILTAVRRKDKR